MKPTTKKQTTTPTVKQKATTDPAPLDLDRKRESLNAVMSNGLECCKLAIKTYNDLRNGALTKEDAKELNNSLGRANGASINIVKAVMAEMVLDKLQANYTAQQAKALSNGAA